MAAELSSCMSSAADNPASTSAAILLSEMTKAMEHQGFQNGCEEARSDIQMLRHQNAVKFPIISADHACSFWTFQGPF